VLTQQQGGRWHRLRGRLRHDPRQGRRRRHWWQPFG
jgi:hypothetical protein